MFIIQDPEWPGGDGGTIAQWFAECGSVARFNIQWRQSHKFIAIATVHWVCSFLFPFRQFCALLCVFACPGFCFLANRNVTQWRQLPPLQQVGLAPLARLSATVQFISTIVPIIRTILLSGLLCCHGEIWRKPRKPEINPSSLIALHLVLERSLFSSNEVCYMAMHTYFFSQETTVKALVLSRL